jgi:hypothetical protein
VTEVQLIVGMKLSEQEQQSVDRTTAVWTTAQPPAGVVGQDSCQYIVCPYCGCVGCLPAPGHAIFCHCCGYLTRAP